jgi:hypothetical protein
MKYVLTTKGDWRDLKTKLKEQYKSLADADLEFSEGKYEDMMVSLCTKLGKTRQEMIRIMNRL